MPSIFEQMQFSKPKMSAFDLSREQKLTCNMGELVPTYLEEVLPGDHFRVRSEMITKLQPLLAPMMHRVDIYMHYFFVPHRLTFNADQKQWENFITGGADGLQAPAMPSIQYSSSVRTSRLSDYMGIPPGTVDDLTINFSSLPFRAYQLIWNEYYRDQTLDTPVDIYTAGPATLTTLRNRAWGKDYFTSALPWTQRGTAQGVAGATTYNSVSLVQPQVGGDTGNLNYDPASRQLRDATTGQPKRIENISAVTIAINALRTASAVQRFLERQAVGGSRLIETILSQFGVRLQDYRLQRPQYLGGGKQPLVISELLSTAEAGTDIVGTQTGQANSMGTINSFDFEVPEHGYIMGIYSVLPKTGYFQGIPKHFMRTNKYDFYWPLLADLGEQEIKNYELYFQPGQTATNNATFGYQQRFAEYKYGVNTVHGLFRNTLKFWHMAREFSSLPALNSTFVTSNPTTRMYAVAGENVMVQLYHDVKARRPMPYFATPELM